MKPVVEYQNFRQFIADYYEERKRCSSFTWRKFAKEAGYSSPVFLKLVCDNKANLSEVGVERVASAMGLSGFELKYFRALVNFNQESNEVSKKSFYKEMRQIAKENRFTLVGEEQYDYYASCLNPIIRELVAQNPQITPAEIVKKISFEVSIKEVKKSLALLQKLGFISQNAKGFKQENKAISTGNLEATALSIREMHHQMGTLAIESLERTPREERDISGLTIGISEDGFFKIQKEIETFRRRVSAIVLEDKDETQVYRLNVQLFPLTQKERSAK